MQSIKHTLIFTRRLAYCSDHAAVRRTDRQCHANIV